MEDKWELGNGWTANLGTRYEHHDTFGGDWASHIGLNKNSMKIPMLTFLGARPLITRLLRCYTLTPRTGLVTLI